ncbi:unnamed protein product, partial [Nesidiocoris tenuis]
MVHDGAVVIANDLPDDAFLPGVHPRTDRTVERFGEFLQIRKRTFDPIFRHRMRVLFHVKVSRLIRARRTPNLQSVKIEC